MSKVLASVCLAAAATALAACNDNNSSPTAATSPTPAPNPSPSGCTHTTLATATRSLTRGVLDSTPFTTTESGRVDITVDWNNPQANVGAFVVQAGTCSQQRFDKPGACSFLVASGNDKPHQMTANLPAGGYELLLNDFGAGARSSSSEMATVQVVQSTGCS